LKKDEYGLKYWARDNFIIDNALVKVNIKSKPTLLDIVNKAKLQGLKTPLLIRFPHLIQKQMERLYKTFNDAINKEGYSGKFQAVFPLKVNQKSGFVNEFIKYAPTYNYGLEAGSKAELLLAITLNNHKAPITVNGFKDIEMIKIAFFAKKIGHNITLIIESLTELKTIIKEAINSPQIPFIGIRIRLYSYGSGTWAKSGGIDSKFGLTVTEMIQAIELLKKESLLSNFKMLHFHIGSQINSVQTIQKALREAGQIYAELKKMGAFNLNTINLGGGLAVEYGQHKTTRYKNYTIEEFASQVIRLLKQISEEKSVEVPNIVTESGRFIAGHHSVLITQVLELFSQDYKEKNLKLKKENPKVIEELILIYKKIDKNNAFEQLHNTIDHLDSIETLFELGYIDLQDRSNIEILGDLITKKILNIVEKEDIIEYDNLLHKVEERYLINASIFQSMPDFWGLGQNFPILPIHNLNKKAVCPASIWDITCDSDGEIDFNEKAPLFLHDIDLKDESYYLGFFLLGAYQEILGMKHNLFDTPTEIIVDIDENGFQIRDIKKTNNLQEILNQVGYSTKEIEEKLKTQIGDLRIFSNIKEFLNMDNYL
jgi:arginine decarboxylase